jgi:hypothetical protein
MLPNNFGNCDDERNTAYDGPGKISITRFSYIRSVVHITLGYGKKICCKSGDWQR